MRQNVPAYRWRERLWRVWTIIGLAVIVATLVWLFAQLSTVLTPFVFAALVVFLLRRPVAALERRGLGRGAAVTVCYLIMVAVLTFVGFVVVPPLLSQLSEFLSDFPKHFEAAQTLWINMQRQYTTLEIPPWLEKAVMSSRDDLARQAGRWSSVIASGIVFAGGRVFSLLLNLFLSLTLAFFALRDLPTIKSEVLLLGGISRRHDLLEVFGRVTGVVEGWIRGQSIIALIIGVLTWLGLQLMGVPYALIIGLIAGVTNLIPYLGPIVGGLIAAISAAFVSPMLVVYTLGYIIVLQQLESMFLQPRVMSEKVHLHPVLVVFSLLVGASFAGLVGMLLALPVAGALNAVFVYYFEKHTKSELATTDGALFRKPECEDSDSEECADEPENADQPASKTTDAKHSARRQADSTEKGSSA